MPGKRKAPTHLRGYVDEASDPRHPEHNKFEWDDAKAGAAYRLQQAERLLEL